MKIIPSIQLTIPVVQMTPKTMGRFIALGMGCIFGGIFALTTHGLLVENNPEMWAVAPYTPYVTGALSALSFGGAFVALRGLFKTATGKDTAKHEAKTLLKSANKGRAI